MGAAEVTRFLTSLAVDGNVAASTQNQALSALLFLYRDVLEHDLPWLDNVVRAKGAQRLPVVLTRADVRAVIQEIQGTPRAHREARDVSHVSALLRHPTTRGQPRHPHRSGAPRSPGRQHNPDLHARPQPWTWRRAEPGRPAARPVNGKAPKAGSETGSAGYPRSG
jgi:hypothetical protein